MKVIKHFQDKYTKKYYRVGAEYKGDRVEELQNKGFLAPSFNLSEYLDGSVKEVKQNVDGLESEQIEELIKIEKDNKSRNTVISHLESLVGE